MRHSTVWLGENTAGSVRLCCSWRGSRHSYVYFYKDRSEQALLVKVKIIRGHKYRCNDSESLSYHLPAYSRKFSLDLDAALTHLRRSVQIADGLMLLIKACFILCCKFLFVLFLSTFRQPMGDLVLLANHCCRIDLKIFGFEKSTVV